MILTIPKCLNYMVHLIQGDTEGLFTFAKSWNGTAFLPLNQPLTSLNSDASGSWGCSAFWNEKWLQFQWTEQFKPQNISAIELALVLLSVAIWGRLWSEHHHLCHCNIQEAVAVINKALAKDNTQDHILCCISFYAAHYSFSTSTCYAPGHHNSATDALSRNNTACFHSILPQARPSPDPILPEVIQMASITSSDWTSPDWRRLFTTTLQRAYASQ